MDALRAAELVVLVMPAGISANLEVGYAVGAGKKTIIYVPDECYADPDDVGRLSQEELMKKRAFEPELMWKMADAIATNFVDFCEMIRTIAPESEPAQPPVLKILREERMHGNA